jgi:hypothetical protein
MNYIMRIQYRRTLYEILRGGALKFESRKWHLQHSENTFCKKLRFSKHCFNGAFSYKSHAKHRKPTFQGKYLHDYLHL